jgi:DNA-binding response OmpR family regulator
LKILIADDSPVARALVTDVLRRAGHTLVVLEDGGKAAAAYEKEDVPDLAVLDWEMPGLTGPEVCRSIRSRPRAISPYLILLTSRSDKSDIVAGLDAGANDYLTKPFLGEELRARVHVGERVVTLQQRLALRVEELEAALAKVNELEGLLPICSYCKKVRDDGNYWHQVETYVAARSAARFSHGVCPDCYERHLKPYLGE